MPWQDEMVRIVRYLITDLDFDNPTYDDARLEETIAVSAQLLQSDIDFVNTYTVTVEPVSIYPDPITPPKDDGFINIVCIQAAVIVLGGELKSAALSSIRVTDGPSTIDYTDVVRNKKTLYLDMKDKLDRAKIQYRAGNSVGGQAILSPYTYDNLLGFYNPN